jgi:hypothetical protein
MPSDVVRDEDCRCVDHHPDHQTRIATATMILKCDAANLRMVKQRQHRRLRTIGGAAMS